MHQGYRSSLSRAPHTPRNEEEIFLMRRAAWRKQATLMVLVSDRRLSHDDKLTVIDLAEKLYGSLMPSSDDALEALARTTWREQTVLMVKPSDSRLTWPEKELVKRIGEKLYGEIGL
jgi:hypothetical protein